MPPLPSVDGQGGFLLSLVTESFAVRALLGSLAAAGLAGLAVRYDLVRSRRARRLLILAPVLTAAAAGLASLADAEAYLPQLWVSTAAATGGAAGQLLELLGDLRVMSDHRQMELLVLAYAAIAGVLLLRRVTGLLAVRRLLRHAEPTVGYGHVVPIVHRYAGQLDVTTPRVVMLPACPGGAFTVGTRRPVIAVDPALVDELDDGELEGLVAHELAHIRRRDALLGLVVGVFHDLTFFLPPLHLVMRWLRREQEESADELASAHTGRPAALASGILKVWQSSRSSQGLRMVCGVVPGRRLALAGVGTPVVQGGRPPGPVSGETKAIAARVERLIAAAPKPTGLRCRAETACAAGVLAAATAASLAVPGWIVSQHDTDMLAFGYLTAQPTTEVESPAFATFRLLAPSAGADIDPPGAVSSAVPPTGTIAAGLAGGTACPCVETPAQLRNAVAATGGDAPSHMLWRNGGHETWELDPLQHEGLRSARPLLTLSDSGPQIGFFLLGRSS